MAAINKNAIKKYQPLIEAATTKEELLKISYEVFLAENEKTANKIDELCIRREMALGLL